MNAAPPASEPRRLRRSRRHKLVAGVCGGIAEYVDVDPTVIRVLYVLVSFLTALIPGLLAYIILMFIMPRADEAQPA